LKKQKLAEGAPIFVPYVKRNEGFL